MSNLIDYRCCDKCGKEYAEREDSPWFLCPVCRGAEAVAVYADGGIIGMNPSPIGGTWAYCWATAQGERILERSGLVVPETREKPEVSLMMNAGATVVSLPLVTNNLTEFVALARCLRTLPEGWSGDVYSDSQITLGRFFHGWPTKGIPDNWAAQIPRIIKRLGTLTPHLLDGHPTKAQLEAGVGKRGNLCSKHNVWCDKECARMAQAYREALARAAGAVVG